MHVSVNAQNVKPSSAVDLAEYGAWVISDVSGLRQRLLQVQQLGPVVAVFHDLHSKGKFNQLSEQLAANKPSFVVGSPFRTILRKWEQER